MDGPEYPEICSHIWQMFLELHSARTSGGFSINPITYTEIDAYCRLMGIELSPEEVYLLKVADEAAMIQVQENMKVERGETDGTGLPSWD